jgi:hypothetical protein
VAEAGVVVAPHAGFEDGYVRVTRAVAEEWGRSETPKGTGDAVDRYAGVVSMLMKHRLVRDFAAVLVADKLFERNPGVRVAFIEKRWNVGGRPAARPSDTPRPESGHVQQEPG